MKEIEKYCKYIIRIVLVGLGLLALSAPIFGAICVAIITGMAFVHSTEKDSPCWIKETVTFYKKYKYASVLISIGLIALQIYISMAIWECGC